MHKHVLFPSVECKLSMNYTSNGKWYHTSYNQDDIIIVCLDCTCSMYNTLYTALVTSMLFLMWLKISPIRQIEQRFTPYCAIIWSALIAKLCEKPTNASIAKEESGLIWSREFAINCAELPSLIKAKFLSVKSYALILFAIDFARKSTGNQPLFRLFFRHFYGQFYSQQLFVGEFAFVSEIFACSHEINAYSTVNFQCISASSWYLWFQWFEYSALRDNLAAEQRMHHCTK